MVRIPTTAMTILTILTTTITRTVMEIEDPICKAQSPDPLDAPGPLPQAATEKRFRQERPPGKPKTFEQLTKHKASQGLRPRNHG